MFDHRQDGKWWDIGLDLVTGCTQVSPGCDHCWNMAAANRKRNFGPGYEHINPKIQARYGGLTDAAGRWTGEVRPQWQDLDKIGRARKPQVYTFWNDLFHPGVSFELADGKEKFLDEIIIEIINHPQHFYIICTKRPERALEYFLSRQADIAAWPGAGDILVRRLMLMITAENQKMANLRVPILLQIPDVLHGVSLEPLLGEIKFRKTWLMPDPEWAPGWQHGHLDWIIAGGETGPRARPSHPDWFRQARDQAAAANVPFFFKSWGEWAWFEKTPPGKRWENRWNGGSPPENNQIGLYRVGKKAAGRLLDGRTWDEVPHV